MGISLEWLSVKEAAALLGVHEATVRRWTRQGYLQAFRTPGGHRRYLKSTLQAFLTRGQGAAPPVMLEVLERRALSQTRRALKERLAAEPWRPRYHRREGALRASGRELLGLLIHYAARERDQEVYLERARQILHRYGREAAELGLSAADTARAFLVFRRAIVEAIARSLSQPPVGDPEGWQLLERADRFFDELLVATLEGHSQVAVAAPPALRLAAVGEAAGGGSA